MKENNILEKIFHFKSKEIEERKNVRSVKTLEEKPFFSRQNRSLAQAIQSKGHTGIIAEYKTRSPSMGMINGNADLKQITQGYLNAGASGLSILTDAHFFGGSLENLEMARKANHAPILQKDFIMDTYQITEAKAYGADAILLIAAMLSKDEILKLSSFAHTLGLEILLEIHQKDELGKINDQIQLVGINNRNLKDFSVNQDHSINLVHSIPEPFVKIAESGIESPYQAFNLLNNGFDGLLIGGEFMKHPKPDESCRDFIDQLRDYMETDKETQTKKQ
jgi:indole-3-glycerol phosphate synthase